MLHSWGVEQMGFRTDGVSNRWEDARFHCATLFNNRWRNDQEKENQDILLFQLEFLSHRSVSILFLDISISRTDVSLRCTSIRTTARTQSSKIIQSHKPLPNRRRLLQIARSQTLKHQRATLTLQFCRCLKGRIDMRVELFLVISDEAAD